MSISKICSSSFNQCFSRRFTKHLSQQRPSTRLSQQRPSTRLSQQRPLTRFSLKRTSTRLLSIQHSFIHQLVTQAQKNPRKILLPEGEEPRIIKAANLCATSNTAKCTLLGNPTKVSLIAQKHNFSLHSSIKIINPTMIYDQYIEPFTQHQPTLTKNDALKALQDPIILGLTMLKEDDVDGLVAGAITPTSHVMGHSLRIIQSKPKERVFSIFFMCFPPDQVLMYTDCAINRIPSVETLAKIAIQSAETACQFSIPPRIAMISYSTKASGQGEDVTKVQQATNLVKQLRPDLIIEGPYQYDTALDPEVAKIKAPDCPVAGKAKVLVFQDLSVGNTVYKAVKQHSNVQVIGPMILGSQKPVNDLSRGASYDEISLSIALTSIQSETSDTITG